MSKCFKTYRDCVNIEFWYSRANVTGKLLFKGEAAV